MLSISPAYTILKYINTTLNQVFAVFILRRHHDYEEHAIRNHCIQTINSASNVTIDKIHTHAPHGSKKFIKIYIEIYLLIMKITSLFPIRIHVELERNAAVCVLMTMLTVSIVS